MTLHSSLGAAIPIWIFLLCFGAASYQIISNWRTPVPRDLEEEFIEKNEESMYKFLFRQGAKRAIDEYGGPERRARAQRKAWRDYSLLCIPVALVISWLFIAFLEQMHC